MRRTVLALVGVVVVTVGLVACGGKRPSGQLELAGRPVDVASMTPEEVQQAVVVADQDGGRIYRGPTLRLRRSVDLRGHAGTMTLGNVGVVELARSGYLLGRRAAGAGEVRHALVYESDLIRGENRYARVALEDGSALTFRVSTLAPQSCERDCLPGIQAVIVEVPEAVLRAAAGQGLTVSMTLDNGHSFLVRGPAAYVRGYLAAVDADQPH